MEKTKIWIKDRFTSSDFQTGERVILVRRKKNGHPRCLKDATPYKIIEIENDNLILENPDYKSNLNMFPSSFKVHFSYFLTSQSIRDEIIKDLLED